MDDLVVQGHNGQLTVNENAVRISRKGLMGWLTFGSQGDKRLPISEIESITFKKPSLFMGGHIHFNMRQGNKGRFDPLKDEYTVVFTKEQEPEFVKAKETIECLLKPSSET